MSDTSKVFMVPDGAGSNGVDPNLLLSMMNNGGMGGNGNWMWVIFLFFLYGWGRNGGLFGNNSDGTGTSYLASLAERDMLMQAINGNSASINSLANYLNTDISSIQSAVCNVLAAIQNVGGQVGMTGQQVINAIQQGNMSIASQLSQCCCENKQLVTTMGYEGQLRDLTNTAAITSRIDQLANGILTGFSSTAYETAQQTCAIQNSVKDLTLTIMDKLSSMQSDAMLDKINNLTAQLTAATSRAERAAELAPIYNQLNAIKAAQPATTTVQYPQLTVFPSYLNTAALAGYYYGGQGFWS